MQQASGDLCHVIRFVANRRMGAPTSGTSYLRQRTEAEKQLGEYATTNRWN